MLYRVHKAVHIVPVLSVWNGVAEIAITVTAIELGTSPFMAPPPLHCAPMGENTPFHLVLSDLPRAAQIRYPFGVMLPVHCGDRGLGARPQHHRLIAQWCIAPTSARHMAAQSAATRSTPPAEHIL